MKNRKRKALITELNTATYEECSLVGQCDRCGYIYGISCPESIAKGKTKALTGKRLKHIINSVKVDNWYFAGTPKFNNNRRYKLSINECEQLAIRRG